MRYKPEAFIYEEEHGAFTRGCSTKEKAQKAILEAVLEYVEDERLEAYFEKPEDVVINIDRIKEDRMYPGHRKCDANYWTVGEDICEGCGDSTGGRGYRTFTYEF